MARQFTGGSSTDRVEAAVANDGSAFLTPVTTDFTAFFIAKRTGASDFSTILSVGQSGSNGWAVTTDQASGSGNDKLIVSALGGSNVLSGLSLTSNTTIAGAVRFEVGVQATFWIHPEGGSVSGGTPVSTAAAPAAPPSLEATITVGNVLSTAGFNIGFPGVVQFTGIVDGLLTDTEVTDTLTALLAGDFSVPSGFDDRFWMSLSPGGTATDPEDDTSPNNQDSSTITGTTAVADLIAASDGTPTAAPDDVTIAVAVTAPTVVYTEANPTLDPNDVSIAVAVTAPTVIASLTVDPADVTVAVAVTAPTVEYTEAPVPTADAYTLSGPDSGLVDVASGAFTVRSNGTLAADVTITPSDGGDGGSFDPATATLLAGDFTQADFTYTPASTGAKTISVTNDGSLTDPSDRTFNAVDTLGGFFPVLARRRGRR